MARVNVTEERLVLSAQDRASQVLQGMQRSLGNLQGTYLKLTAAVGSGVALAAGFTAFLGNAVKTRSALDDLADTTGDSVKTLDGLARQARVAGTDFDQLAGGLAKFARNLNSADDEGKGAGKALAAIGIGIDGLRAKKPGEALIEVAQALGKFEDGAGKVAVAVALMGKEGAKMLPFLKDIAEDGAIAGRITAEQAAQAERLEKEWRRLKQAFVDSKDALADSAIPAIREYLEEMREGIRITGSFGEALLVLSAINPFRTVSSNLQQLTTDIERLEAARVRSRAKGFGDDVAAIDADLRVFRAQQEFLKFQQRNEALRLAVPESLDARDLKARQKPVLEFKPEGATKGKIQDLDSAYRNLLKTLNEKLLVDGQSTELARLQLTLEAMGAKQRAAIGPQREAELKALAAQIDLNKRQASQMANNARNFAAEEEFREESARALAEEASKRDEAILAGYRHAEQIEFETSLIGLSNEAREKAITLRALEASGIRESDAAFAQLAQRLKGAIADKSIAEANQRTADEIMDQWRDAAQNMQQTMSGVFFDVMQGNLDSVGRSFKYFLDRMVSDALAARAQIALFGPDFAKGGNIGGLIGKGLDFLNRPSNIAFGSTTFASAFASGVIPMAQGGDFMVTKPTLFLAGEAGHERATFTPAGKGGGRGMTLIQNFTVSGATDRRSQSQIAAAAGEGVRRAMERYS